MAGRTHDVNPWFEGKRETHFMQRYVILFPATARPLDYALGKWEIGFLPATGFAGHLQ